MTNREFEEYKHNEMYMEEDETVDSEENLTLYDYQPKRESYLDLSTLISNQLNKRHYQEKGRSSFKKKKQRKGQFNTSNFTKTHIKYISDPFFSNIESSVKSNEKSEGQENLKSIHCNFPKEQIGPEYLEERYGHHYIEGEIYPRRFCITENVKEPKSSKIVVIVKAEINHIADIKIDFKGFKHSFDFKNILQSIENGMDFEKVVRILYPHIAVKATNQESNLENTSLKPFETKLLNDILLESGFLRNKKDDGIANFNSFKLAAKNKECSICFQTGEENFLAAKKCLHYFCKACWKSYIKSKVIGGFSGAIKCMEFDCKISIDAVSILSIVSWKSFCLYVSEFQNQLIKKENLLQKCPTDSCQSIITINDSDLISSLSNWRKGSTFTDSLSVTCASCHKKWCFSCKQPKHWPISCQVYGKLKTIRDSFNITGSMKIVSGKNCPFCGNFIEKNGGCMTMTCICTSEHFCWKCTRPDSEHNFKFECIETDEQKFLPKIKTKEARALQCLELFASAGNKDLPKLFKFRKGPKPRGYATAMESFKVLKESMDTCLMMSIAIIMDRSVPVIYKSCLNKLRFNNSLLYQLIDYGLQAKSLDTIAMKNICQDINNINAKMSKSLLKQ